MQGVRNLIQVTTTVPDQELQSKLADRLRYDRIGFGIMFNSLTLRVKDGVVEVGGKVLDYPSAASAIATLIACAPCDPPNTSTRVAPARDASGSFGSPSTRSPRMLRMMSEVPPSMVLAWARRKPEAVALAASATAPTRPTRSMRDRFAPSHAMADAPSRSIARFWSRWLNSACCSFVIDPSGPASAPEPPSPFAGVFSLRTFWITCAVGVTLRSQPRLPPPWRANRLLSKELISYGQLVLDMIKGSPRYADASCIG